MNPPEPAVIVADAVRERLTVVEAACLVVISPVGAFPDPDAVDRQLPTCVPKSTLRGRRF